MFIFISVYNSIDFIKPFATVEICIYSRLCQK